MRISRLAATALSSIALTALALSVHSRPVDACSAPAPPVPERHFVPGVNAVSVAINTRVVVRDELTTNEIAGELELRDENGALVALTLEQVRDRNGETLTIATPSEALRANTRYEVFLRPIIGEHCSENTDDCFGSELAVVSTFTTGISADTTPPEFPGSATVSEQTEEICVDCSCDFNWGTAYRTFGWPDATDDSGSVLYNIYAEGNLQNILRTSSSARVGRTCWGNDSQSGGPATIGYNEGEYLAVAVDSAGNETASMPLVLPPFDCTEIDKSDPNNSEDPPETPAEDDRSGCASAGGRTTGIGALLLLFALRRQRRKQQNA